MRLFTDRERNDVGPAWYAESHFPYLDRTARDDFSAVRDIVEDWVAEYPRFHRRELISRLRTKDDLQFTAAFFELYLYRLFTARGARVDVHPRLSHRTRRPDFRIEMSTGQRFLLEAASVIEGSMGDRVAAGRLAPLYDALNRVTSPDFFFQVQHYGLPGSPLPGRVIRKQLEGWLKGLNYQEIQRSVKGDPFRGPSVEFVHDGCRLVISVLPVTEANRGSVGNRPVGIIGPGEVRTVNHWSALRDAIKAKATRYGRLRQPYVIAVNAVDDRAQMIDAMQALFGQEVMVIDRDHSGRPGKARMSRKGNGAWLGPAGPINRRVSAVLVIGQLLPWTAGMRRPVVYHNPWARYPLQGAFPWLDNHVPSSHKMVRKAARGGRNLIGLPANWPRGLLSGSR